MSTSTLERWQAELDAIKARLAPPGVPPPEAVRNRSGMEFLQAIGTGELPSVPIGALLDFHPILAEPGRMVFQGRPRPEHYNPIGTVHGGWIATLLDSAMACAVQTLVPKGSGYTTLELKVNFVRAVRVETGPVRAEGRMINVGRQSGVAEGRLTDAEGRLYAWGSTTCLVFALPGG